MTEKKAIRLSKIAREFNVGISTIVDFLHKKGHNIDVDPNSKVAPELYDLLVKEYSSDLDEKKKSEKFSLKNLREKKESISIDDVEVIPEAEEEEEEFLVKDTSVSTPKLSRKNRLKRKFPKKQKQVGPKVVGKVDLDEVQGKKKVVKEKEEMKEETVTEEKEPPVKDEKAEEEKMKPSPKKNPKLIKKRRRRRRARNRA